MKTAMIGDNCIDVYVRINGEVVKRCYPTGNCVDTGVISASLEFLRRLSVLLAVTMKVCG